jgi:hypothetical protein
MEEKNRSNRMELEACPVSYMLWFDPGPRDDSFLAKVDDRGPNGFIIDL